MRDPIIKSLLDLDFYKLTMAQVAFKHFAKMPVTFGFKNRTTSVKIANFVELNDLIFELEQVKTLRFKEDELNYLRSCKIFSEKFLEFLQDLQLPDFRICNKEGQFEIEFEGNWPEVTFWETICLSILNELYYRFVLSKMTNREQIALKQEGKIRLENKILELKKHSEIKFSEFGTRRRFSCEWQEEVVKILAQKVPNQFLGTSNVYLAMKLGLRPIGTFAHEMYMIMSGIFRNEKDGILRSHNKVLEYWWEEYGQDLSIALTDTYGTDFFFSDITVSQAEAWRGLRHDSGDPIEFGEKAIKFYDNLDINPEDKTIVFSDGLNLETIIKITQHFHGRINCVFGWGTNLTNDFGLKTLSMVIKAIRANNYGTVKLSDNLVKAMGSEEDIQLFKKIFKHNVNYHETCVY